ncbi:hypothetical protein [Pseudomonas phage 98PfluR60PP]|uniref:Uncharacterized protein n=1 Tax=Pseudomonas phage 98PfluR60PP TaxID=2163965 RepID=A0A2S1PG30_9CAUD|nr:hypothetical protein PP760_gp88 [Pseudomonas phage 98PfluR60PP]AWH15520.1 hypothetical protein [Pseudomonas phage 98PfluR60PP]
MKPVVSIKLTRDRGINAQEFNKSRTIEFEPRDQHWIADCIYTSFEGAKRFQQFHSMYKIKALLKAYEWLAEQKDIDAAVQRKLNKKKDHRSTSYSTKMRLRQTRIKSTMGDVRYRITYRDVGDEKALYFGYGDTPHEAYLALVDAMSSVNQKVHRRNSEGVVIGLTRVFEPTKYRQHWWQFWRPKL